MRKSISDPSFEELQPIVKLFNQGQLQQTLPRIAEMLDQFPNSAALYNIYGASFAGLMQLDHAIDSYKKAIKIKPDYAEAYNNLGSALNRIGSIEEAIDSCKQALKIKPNYAEAYNNLGNAQQKNGSMEEAIDSYIQALKISPNDANAYYNMGIARQEMGDLQKAIDCYIHALEINPKYADAYNNIGAAQKDQNDLEAAIASCKKALEINPNYANAYYNMGLALLCAGKRKNALLNFRKSHELIRGKNPANPFHISFSRISKSKINHDIEQFIHLAESGCETEKFQSLAKLYTKISLEIDWSDEEIQQLSKEHQKQLEETYNRTIKYIEAPELANGALNSALEKDKITKDYFNHDYGLTYVDNFLTHDALNSIRKFLLESTIWFDIKKGGYLGAYLKEGLACPLLLQIADELRGRLPEIFKHHQLKHLWAYKYDSKAHKNNNELTGIKAHADQAAVNVNFWITPASANLNSESGGLIVYNTDAPLEWGFQAYNSHNSNNKIDKYLEKASPEKSIIPYNENRAVIFNSNLIHETDKFEFKEGYENRRINITMLFGLREN